MVDTARKSDSDENTALRKELSYLKGRKTIIDTVLIYGIETWLMTQKVYC